LNDRFDEFGSRLERLAAEVAALSRRVAVLEGSPRDEGATVPAVEVEGQELAAEHAADLGMPSSPSLLDRIGTTPVGLASFVGRTLLVLAGAYLLRAITDAGWAPKAAGVTLGLAYAGSWLAMSAVAAARAVRASAVFHGLASSLIAFPLIWETTYRFGLLSPVSAAALLAAFFVAGLVVAVRWHLPETAWISTLFALTTAAALFVGTRHLVPFAISLLVIAAATEIVSVAGRWLAIRWPVALLTDAAVLILAVIVSRPQGVPESYTPIAPPAAIAVLLVLAFLYLIAAGARNLARREPVSGFDVFQALAALAIGLGGAVRITFATGGTGALIGAMASILGLACYGATFVFADRREGHERNFYFYSTLGGLLLLSGTALMVRGAALSIAWGLLALLVVWAGRRYGRFTLRLHGAVYVAAAAAASGLIAGGAQRIFGTFEQGWPAAPPISYAVVAVIAVCYAMLIGLRRDVESVHWARLIPQAIAAATLCWCVAGLAIGAVFNIALGLPGVTPDGAVVATVRTGAFAALAVLLAWAGRRFALRDLTWLAYLLLAVGGLKLLVEDLRLGRPGTLFLSFALYGIALIVAPRLLRRAR